MRCIVPGSSGCFAYSVIHCDAEWKRSALLPIAYENAVLLKTGLYNYQYKFLEDGETKPSFKQTEGNYFETENEYTITVYYRPMGARYDRLIGHKTVSNK